eukprot:jgi/Mesvir1/6197/Mv00881-RA.2
MLRNFGRSRLPRQPTAPERPGPRRARRFGRAIAAVAILATVALALLTQAPFHQRAADDTELRLRLERLLREVDADDLAADTESDRDDDNDNYRFLKEDSSRNDTRNAQGPPASLDDYHKRSVSLLKASSNGQYSLTSGSHLGVTGGSAHTVIGSGLNSSDRSELEMPAVDLPSRQQEPLTHEDTSASTHADPHSGTLPASLPVPDDSRFPTLPDSAPSSSSQSTHMPWLRPQPADAQPFDKLAGTHGAPTPTPGGARFALQGGGLQKLAADIAEAQRVAAAASSKAVQGAAALVGSPPRPGGQGFYTAWSHRLSPSIPSAGGTLQGVGGENLQGVSTGALADVGAPPRLAGWEATSLLDRVMQQRSRAGEGLPSSSLPHGITASTSQALTASSLATSSSPPRYPAPLLPLPRTGSGSGRGGFPYRTPPTGLPPVSTLAGARQGAVGPAPSSLSLPQGPGQGAMRTAFGRFFAPVSPIAITPARVLPLPTTAGAGAASWAGGSQGSWSSGGGRTGGRLGFLLSHSSDGHGDHLTSWQGSYRDTVAELQGRGWSKTGSPPPMRAQPLPASKVPSKREDASSPAWPTRWVAQPAPIAPGAAQLAGMGGMGSGRGREGGGGGDVTVASIMPAVDGGDDHMGPQDGPMRARDGVLPSFSWERPGTEGDSTELDASSSFDASSVAPDDYNDPEDEGEQGGGGGWSGAHGGSKLSSGGGAAGKHKAKKKPVAAPKARASGSNHQAGGGKHGPGFVGANVKDHEGSGGLSAAGCGHVENGDVAVGVMSRIRKAPDWVKRMKALEGKVSSEVAAKFYAQHLGNQGAPAAGPRDLIEALQRTWLQWMSHAVVFTKTEGGKRADYLVLLDKLRAAFPKKKWYLLVHDDTYIYVRRLLCYLDTLKHHDAVYTGMTHCCGPNFKCSSGPVKGFLGKPGEVPPENRGLGGWLNGGAGVVLSGALVNRMNLKECQRYYEANWRYDLPATDVVLACCVQDSGGERVHGKGFTAGKPGFAECQCNGTPEGGLPRKGDPPSCSLPANASPKLRISWHHVKPADFDELYRKENQELGKMGGIKPSK